MLSLLSELFKKVKEMLASYKRVLIIARKPDKEEFVKTAKICFIGMGIVGLIGFIIYAISILFLA